MGVPIAQQVIEHETFHERGARARTAVGRDELGEHIDHRSEFALILGRRGFAHQRGGFLEAGKVAVLADVEALHQQQLAIGAQTCCAERQMPAFSKTLRQVCSFTARNGKRLVEAFRI